MNEYVKLVISGLLPVIIAIVVYLLDSYTKFGHLKSTIKQIIIGILFGILAIIGTEWGVPINGAQVNARDGSVLIAGLIFGGPAGIIAGIIGGVERWISVAWGIGSFTRVACSVSTILAGFFAAALKKYMFENKRPDGITGFVIGVVMEVFHLSMVFFTNMKTPTEALNVIFACTVPIVLVNGFAIFIATAAISVLSYHKNKNTKRSKPTISMIIQRWLILTIVLAFVASSLFVHSLQNRLAQSQEQKLLTMALDEIQAEIIDTSDKNLINLAHTVVEDLKVIDIRLAAKKYRLAEISIINDKGIIVDSTNTSFIGYDMASGEQSAEFLILLGDVKEYAQQYGPISYDESISRKFAGVKTESGFIQISYDAERFQSDIDATIDSFARNRHVGQTGYMIILDASYVPVSVTEGHTIGDLSDIDPNILPGDNVVFDYTIENEPCRVCYREVEGYFLVSILPKAEVLLTRNTAVYVNGFMQILLFAVMFGIIFALIKRTVVDKIQSVNTSLSNISNGNLNEVVDVRMSKEFDELSGDINHTVDTLKDYIDKAEKRIEAELELAKNIQASALPSNFPAFPQRKDFDIFASMNPAKEVGGDFYDFYMTDSETLNFLIADVSGKGIPAAMFMMRAKTELKTLTEAGQDLANVFTNGNAALCEGNDAGMFVTALQGSVNLLTGNASFVNAGHNPPLLKHKDGSFEYLKLKSGFILAGMDGMTYKTQDMKLAPGDVLFLYTDGVTEATNINNELFGEDRLLETLNSNLDLKVDELCKCVKAKVDEFVGEAPQFDDITMVAFKFIGAPSIPSIHFENASIDDITKITEFVEAELEKIDCPMKIVTSIDIAIDELYSNIVKYAYIDKTGPATVKVVYNQVTKIVSIVFIDEGIPYNPLMKADPDITLSAEERKIGGLGIYMVKKTMDNIKYKYENDQNFLTIQKKIGD